MNVSEDAPGLQADLIGSGKEGRKDGKRRTKLHAQWAAERDEKDMAGVVAAMKSGWRRSRRRGLDGEDVRPLTIGPSTSLLLHTSVIDVTTSSCTVLLTTVSAPERVPAPPVPGLLLGTGDRMRSVQNQHGSQDPSSDVNDDASKTMSAQS